MSAKTAREILHFDRQTERQNDRLVDWQQGSLKLSAGEPIKEEIKTKQTPVQVQNPWSSPNETGKTMEDRLCERDEF